MHLSGGRPVDEVIGLFWELHARLLWEVGEQTRAVVVENKQFVERAEDEVGLGSAVDGDGEERGLLDLDEVLVGGLCDVRGGLAFVEDLAAHHEAAGRWLRVGGVDVELVGGGQVVDQVGGRRGQLDIVLLPSRIHLNL